MTLEEIKAYSVAENAAADCFLFLWVPSRRLACPGEPLMNAWGFKLLLARRSPGSS